ATVVGAAALEVDVDGDVVGAADQPARRQAQGAVGVVAAVGQVDAEVGLGHAEGPAEVAVDVALLEGRPPGAAAQGAGVAGGEPVGAARRAGRRPDVEDRPVHLVGAGGRARVDAAALVHGVAPPVVGRGPLG